MLFKRHTQALQLPDGSTIHLETGKLAQLAHGSALLRQGDTMLLATVSREKSKGDPGFLPLTVDYQENYASVGRIRGGFLKREGRPTDHEILVARLVDRAIRPCFPKVYADNVQVRIMLLSSDQVTAPDALVALATSTALMLSPLPFSDPISEVRVARLNGDLVVNPSDKEAQHADMDIVVAATHDRILMIEGEMDEVDEEDLIEAIQFAHEVIKTQCEAQNKLVKAVGVVKEEVPQEVVPPRYVVCEEAFFKPLYEVARRGINTKAGRKEAFDKVFDSYISSQSEELSPEDEDEIRTCFKIVKNKAIRTLLLEEGRRIDGREAEDIREIATEVDCLPTAHGSALFTRGETQVLASVTLGGKQDEQVVDGVTKNGYNKVMLHYDFPPFSTGDVKPNRGPSRREVGHANLALRALRPMLAEDPYTKRIHSIVLASNGSSSQATVCASSLALMDAGIQIRKTLAGIAMGLVADPERGKAVILSDILGEEDQIGDMDFKVAGTKDGLTACQMDIKVSGLSYDLLRKALQQAKKGRLHIISKMEETLSSARSDLKAHSPRIDSFRIPGDTIGAVIGKGGEVIKAMQDETGTTITIHEDNREGVVQILAPSKTSLIDARGRIKAIVEGPQVGQIYQGVVKAIQKYGVFVEFIPGSGIDGLLHVSHMGGKRLSPEEIAEMFPVGKHIRVQLIEAKGGRYSLTTQIEGGDTTEDDDHTLA